MDVAAFAKPRAAEDQTVNRIARSLSLNERENRAGKPGRGRFWSEFDYHVWIHRRASTQPDWVAGDGLHPSGEQYAAWVAEVVKAVVKE